MKKIITGATLSLLAVGAMAQETYESAQLATQDLNGTARYVGMGGAMEALGADISTINTNPAGIGVFRRSWIGASAGATIQQANTANEYNIKFNNSGISNADLNQVGFVWTNQTSEDTWINVAVNYQKSRNFNQIINAVNTLNDASVNRMSAIRLSSYKPTTWKKDTRWTYMSLIDALNYTAVNNNCSETYFSSKEESYFDDYLQGAGYLGEQRLNGYISNFDFNLSGNIHNRIFLGMTVGLKDVHYHNEAHYKESLLDPDESIPTIAGIYDFNDDRRITGSGVDIKVGAIFRPIEDNPFRIGLYINTPTWYDLSCDGRMSAYGDYAIQGTPYYNDDAYNYSFDYKIITPWKFGASVGTTVGNKFAFGATYEFSDYSSIKNRIVDGEYTSYWDDYYDWGYDYYNASSNDNQMNRNTEKSLKGVSLFKVGAEFKPVPNVALRAGYNYQGAIYESNGFKDMIDIDANLDEGSVGSYYSTYDYTNWKETHRITFGLGFALSKNTNFDISYQYATQKGEYHPFQDVNGLRTYYGESGTISQHANLEYCKPTASNVKNDRHQINATLSYKF